MLLLESLLVARLMKILGPTVFLVLLLLLSLEDKPCAYWAGKGAAFDSYEGGPCDREREGKMNKVMAEVWTITAIWATIHN